MCRVEYDAYRSDLEAMQAAPRVGDSTAAQKLEDAQQRYQSHKEKFEKLRSDVSIKMKFLDENRVICLFLLATADGTEMVQVTPLRRTLVFFSLVQMY